MAQGEQKTEQKISPEVLAVIAAMSEANQKAMLEFAKELKKPTDVEQAKLDKEKAGLLQRELEARDRVVAEMKGREIARRNCPHFRTLASGATKHSFRGQITSGDNLVHANCSQCHTEWPPFSAKLLPDEGKGGANLEVAVLNPAVLTELHKATYPHKCARTRCFVCYPEQAVSA